MNEETTPKIDNPTVAKSVAKPTAFAKPGTMKPGTRFRPLAVNSKVPKARRHRKRDPRYVEFY